MDLSAKVSNLEGRIQKLEGRTDEGTIESGAGISSFPATGSPGSIYVDTTTGKAYLWDSTTGTYVPIGGGSSAASVRIITATPYTLQESDNGSIIFFAVQTPGVLTIPPLSEGFNCVVWQGDSGQITATPDNVILSQADNKFTTEKMFAAFTLNMFTAQSGAIQGRLV